MRPFAFLDPPLLSSTEYDQQIQYASRILIGSQRQHVPIKESRVRQGFAVAKQSGGASCYVRYTCSRRCDVPQEHHWQVTECNGLGYRFPPLPFVSSFRHENSPCLRFSAHQHISTRSRTTTKFRHAASKASKISTLLCPLKTYDPHLFQP